MRIIGQSTTESGIQKVSFTESEGIVEINIRSVEKSLFYKSTFDETFNASQDMPANQNQQSKSSGPTVKRFHHFTAMLYQNYNPYVGDMPQNGKLVSHT